MANQVNTMASIIGNNSLITALDNLLTAHTNAKNNPHDVTASQVGAYTKAEVNSNFTPQTTTINAYPLSANIALDASDVGAIDVDLLDTLVPTSRTINGHSLEANIALVPDDVGAAPVAHKHPMADINGLGAALDGKADVEYVDDNFSPLGHVHPDLVPTSRTVNDKPLTANITLAKGDIGLSKVNNWDASDDAVAGTSNSYASSIAAKQAYDRGSAGITKAEEALGLIDDLTATVSGSLQHLGSIDLSEGEYPDKPDKSSIWFVEVGGTVSDPENTFYLGSSEGDEVEYEKGDSLVFSIDLDLFYRVTDKKGISRDEANESFLGIDAAASDSNLLQGVSKAAVVTEARNDRVPLTRTVNSKKLDDDIVLNANDVNAIPATELAKLVPTTRTINNKSLDNDVVISKGDVGLSKVVNGELSSDIDSNADNVYASSSAAKSAYDRGTTALSKANAVEASLNDHAGKKDNPHSVTAAQVNAYTKAEADNKFLTTIDGDISVGSLTINGLPDGDLDDAVLKYDPTTGKLVLTVGDLEHILMDTEGNLIAAGDTFATSDVSLKEDLSPIKNALEIICGWTGYEYFRTDLKRPQVGLVAQEVQKSAPLLVKEGRNGLLSLSYEKMTAYLVEGLKGAVNLIHAQNKSIEILKGEISKLKK